MSQQVLCDWGGGAVGTRGHQVVGGLLKGQDLKGRA